MILSSNSELNEDELNISSEESVEEEEFDHIEQLMGVKKNDQSSSSAGGTAYKNTEEQIQKHTSVEIETDEILSKYISKTWKDVPFGKAAKQPHEKELSTSSSNGKKLSVVSLSSKESLSRAEDCIQKEVLRIIEDDSQRKIQRNELEPSSTTVIEQPAFLEDSEMEFDSFDKSLCCPESKKCLIKSVFATGNWTSESESVNNGWSEINKLNEYEEINEISNNISNNNANNNWLLNYYSPFLKTSETYTTYNNCFCNGITNNDNNQKGNYMSVLKKEKEKEGCLKECQHETCIAEDYYDGDVEGGKCKGLFVCPVVDSEVNRIWNTLAITEPNPGNPWKTCDKTVNTKYASIQEKNAMKQSNPNPNPNSSTPPKSTISKPQDQNSLNLLMTQSNDIILNCLTLAKEQFGCRTLQREIEKEPTILPQLLFKQIKDHFSEWSCDIFGNYFIQKWIENLPSSTIQEIVQTFLRSDFKTLCLNQYGTRVIQIIIQSAKQNEFLIKAITWWIQHNLSSFIYDQNASHVISAYLSTIPFPWNDFVYSYLIDNIFKSSTDKFSCLVLQKAIQNATPKQSNTLLLAISKCSIRLFDNQFGNYVLQYTIAVCNYYINHTIVLNLWTDFQKFSSMKYSSSIIEKCMQCSKKETLILIYERWCKDSSLTQGLLCNSYGNYVMQRAWSCAPEPYRHKLLEIVGHNLEKLKTLSFGNKLYSKLIQTYPELLTFVRKQVVYTSSNSININSMGIHGANCQIINNKHNKNNNTNTNTNTNNINILPGMLPITTPNTSGRTLLMNQCNNNNNNNLYITNNGLLADTNVYNTSLLFPGQIYNTQSNQTNDHNLNHLKYPQIQSKTTVNKPQINLYVNSPGNGMYSNSTIN